MLKLTLANPSALFKIKLVMAHIFLLWDLDHARIIMPSSLSLDSESLSEYIPNATDD